MPSVRTHPEVAAALRDRRPVVALETAVVTHGLPRIPLNGSPAGTGHHWNAGLPAHLAAAIMLKRTVIEAGATPAVIGMLDGELIIGLDDDELDRLAGDLDARKISTRDLATASVSRASGGTTVAATLRACMLANPGPIETFATGGIGGVHRHWTTSPDISADLAELARTPVCVVCAGAKSILDVPATIEALDALRITVVGYRTSSFPRFVCDADDACTVPQRVDDPRQVARVCRAQWETFAHRAAVLTVQPVDDALAIHPATYENAVETAEAEAYERGIAASDRTPFILSRANELTDGRALAANLSLLRANGALAAQIAISLCVDESHP